MMARILSFVISCYLFAPGASAQTSQKQLITPYFSALVVTNIDSSIAWYTNVLSLKVLNRVENAERGFKQANISNDRILIELIELNSSLLPSKALEGLPRGSRMVGYFKLGFEVSDIDAWHKELEKKEVEFFGNSFTDPITGKRMFLVKDPDGNILQFFERKQAP